MLDGLRAVFTAPASDADARAVVLTASGRSFRSGAHHSMLLGQTQLTADGRRITGETGDLHA